MVCEHKDVLIVSGVKYFFICDVILNFRTSYYDANGFRENRPSRITQHYLRSWFLIDFVSCLPYGYVQYFFPHDADDNSSQLKAIKAVRLMKITKVCLNSAAVIHTRINLTPGTSWWADR